MKRIIIILSTLIMTLMMGMTVLGAETEGGESLKIGGYIDLIEDNNIRVPYGLSYDRDTNTLTLDNCTIEEIGNPTYRALIDYEGDRPLNIILKGNNTLKTSAYDRTLYINKGIYISKSTELGDASVNITGDGVLNFVECSSAIFSPDSNVKININNVTLNSDRGGIRCLGELSIQNSTVFLKNCDLPAMRCFKYNLNDSYIYAGKDKLEKQVEENELLEQIESEYWGNVFQVKKDFNWILLSGKEVDFSEYNDKIEKPIVEPTTNSTEKTEDEIGTIFRVTNYAGHTVYYKKISKDTVEFCGCETNKTKITIPDEIRLGNLYSKNYKVTSVAPNVFKNNKSIKKVTIGANVKTIGKKAFYGCKNLKTIIVQTKKLKAANVGKKAFKGISVNAKITVPKGKKKSYIKLLRAKGVSKKASIEVSYTKPVVFVISKNENHTVYYKKTGKNTVEYMKCYTNKANLIVPKQIKVDGKTYKVTSIGVKAVAGNKKNQKVTISSNVKKIGKKAFYKCKNLKTIVIKSKKLKMKNVGTKAFAGISKTAIIKVPK